MTRVTFLSRPTVLLATVLSFALGNVSLRSSALTVPTSGELAAAHRWIIAKIETPSASPRPDTGLVVLANHDAVLRNTRGGRPLAIGKTTYARGLYCHAVSKVLVRLPGPGKSFSAIVGVDTNEQTSGGRGSIEFSVSAGGKRAFRSAVLHEGMPAVPVAVELGGAHEFLLEVGDAGDGISCDQADWAEAKVILDDGKVVWLGDLPFVEETTDSQSQPPFSFLYGGQPSISLLGDWKVNRESRPLDENRIRHTVVYADPKTHLAVRWSAIEYRDFPTVEWTVDFKNEGVADTPLLSEIQAVDVRFRRGAEGEFALHHNTGSPCSPNDYEPHVTPLGSGAMERIATAGGRSTNSNLPYFNIEWPGQGVIIVLGWPGQWAAEFARVGARGLRVRGGQELTRFKLHPGEEVRSPLAVVQFWRGEWIRSQNLWRRWMQAHNLPRPGGKPMPPAVMACMSDSYPGMKSNAHDELHYLDLFEKGGAKLDYWWIDAGWYPCGDGWTNVGTWDPDPQRYPKGLREVADAAHARGMKLVVWFEPERVTRGSWLAKQHPGWVLGGKDGGLLNLGNHHAQSWLVEHIDTMIRQQGIDLYRQDFNMEPLGYWRGNDPPDRQGISEIRHVEGLLAFWDELRRRHPGMPIDTCASGGRRNDLETLRRAFPLLRSDYRFEPAGTQGHTYGMALWIPYYGTGVGESGDYVDRSHWCPWLGIGAELPGNKDSWAHFHRAVAQLRCVAPYFAGDYYPLSPYSLDNSAWIAWQFDRPELGGGLVQVFRRTESFYEAARFSLHGLEPQTKYTVTDLDSGRTQQMSGHELAAGLKVTLDKRASAAVLLYRKTKQ